MDREKSIEKTLKKPIIIPITLIILTIISTTLMITLKPKKPSITQARIIDHSFNKPQATIRLEQGKRKARYRVHSPSLNTQRTVKLEPEEIKEITLQGKNSTTLQHITVEIEPISKEINSKQPYTLRVNRKVV